MNRLIAHPAAMLLAVMLAAPSASAVVAQFDINDFGTASPTLSGWTAVTGAADNAKTLTGTDGTHTLTLTTSGDGQDRNRNAGSFPADANFWRDFWFVRDSAVGGKTATATITGLAANTFYTVKIWAFDITSTGNRVAVWTDGVTGNSATLAFNGSTTPIPASLSDSMITLQGKTNATGALTLTGAPAAGGSTEPNVFVTGISVSADAVPLPVVEAESGTLGGEFTVNTLDGADNITISTNSTAYNPGSAARVASYAVRFPSADTYQLYARVRVGPGSFTDDSFFYGNGFGAKSPTTDSNWVAVVNGVNTTGFTAATDVVTVGGGTAGTQVWKWMKFGTLFTVPSGSLTQTFQIGGREDGFSMDKFVFGPSSANLTVEELDSGMIAPPANYEVFDGPDGMAIHRFSLPARGITPDGANPASGLVLIDGTLQGTTLNGGLGGAGASFRAALDGSTFETLKSFSGSDAAHPQGGLHVSGSGFFGVSQAGGTSGTGTVFERKADGTVSIIRSFNSVSADTGANVGGASPSGSLAVSGSVLYGAASTGGANGNGTIFWVATNGANFTVLKEFSLLDSRFGTNSDGAQPRGGLVLAGGKLYGSTSAGGTGGSGVIFAMNTTGANYTVLHHFSPLDTVTAANADGAIPGGGLVVSNGVIYGTTLSGGAGGKGAVFAIDTDGSDFLTLYSFSASHADGAAPAAGLFQSGNAFYGVTSAGGAGGTGTVFALDPFVPDFRVFHHFEPVVADGTNDFGAHPVAPLLRVGNALFGTTFSGGPGATGTVFRVPIPLTAQLVAAVNSNGNVNATFIGRGAPNSNYTIQASNDLTFWQNVTTQSADASGFATYPESNLTTPKRFYRIKDAP